jgi:hypothetical protein
MVASILDPVTPTGAPPTLASKGVVSNERQQALVDLFQHQHVQPAVVNDVGHGGLMSRQRSNPLLALDGVLLVASAEELANSHQPIVAELQAVLCHLPSVHSGVVGRDNGELVIQQPAVDERQVVILAKLVNPDVMVEQNLAEVLQQPALGLEWVGLVVIKDGDDVRLALAHLFVAHTEDHPEIGA